jgi:hypothetical protein
MMPSSRVLNATVSVQTKARENVGGVELVTTTTTSRKASPQPMRASRAQGYGLQIGQTGYTVFFRANPGVDAEDIISWSGRTLSVLGPARDEAGRGHVYAVDCVEQA